jgi:hypothetical protein
VVAERKNRTIIGATKEMIHDHNLPMILWAEASMTTLYENESSSDFEKHDSRRSFHWIES